MTNFLLHILGNSLALYLAALFFKGVVFTGDIIELVFAGLFLGVLNFFIKPILKIISAPLILLTLGAFIFIINLFILWVTQYIIPALSLEGFWAYFWTLLLITFVNFAINQSHEA